MCPEPIYPREAETVAFTVKKCMAILPPVTATGQLPQANHLSDQAPGAHCPRGLWGECLQENMIITSFWL